MRFVMVFIAYVFSGASALAGGLTPPAGPVVETMKTLDEVEARIPIGPLTTPGDSQSIYRITESGSYYLTGDIIPTASILYAIKVEDVPDVTIDLNGYSIEGGGFVSIAIQTQGSQRMTVRNGAIRDVYVGVGEFGSRPRLRMESVDIRDATYGALIGGYSIIRECLFENMAESGVTGALANGVQVLNSTFWGGNVAAVRLNDRAIVREVTVVNAPGFGILVGDDSTVERCVVTGSGSDGISAGARARVAGCQSSSNVERGIEVGGSSIVEDCTASLNMDDGIRAEDGSIVRACVVTNSSDAGISVAQRSLVEGCVVRLNAVDGIRTSSECRVVDNAVSRNGNGGLGAGIYAQGNGSRIEGNNVHENGDAIRCDNSRNLIVRNDLYLNAANFNVPAGQAVASSSDPTTAGPWHNITH